MSNARVEWLRNLRAFDAREQLCRVVSCLQAREERACIILPRRDVETSEDLPIPCEHTALAYEGLRREGAAQTKHRCAEGYSQGACGRVHLRPIHTARVWAAPRVLGVQRV